MNKFLKIFIFFFVLALIVGGVFFIFSKKKTYTLKIESLNPEIAKEIISEELIAEKEKNDAVTSENSINKIDKIEESIKKKTETEKDSASQLEVKNNLVSFGFEKTSGRMIDTVVIHSSYDALGDDPYDVSGLIKEYQQYGVAPHYLIDRKGIIYLLVEEKNIAYHAGVSGVPDGRSGVNAFSIGIELMNTKTDNYTDVQYENLKKLLADIGKRYKIKYTLGHKDVSPGRKDDPWNFDSNKL